MEHPSSKQNSEFNWVKRIYFYLILASTISVIAVTSCVLIYSSAVRFVFTDLQTRPYISYEDCKSNFNYYEPSMPTPYEGDGVKFGESMTPAQPVVNPQLTNDEKKTCADKKISIEYQQVALSTGLAILIAGSILAIHIYLFKFRKNKID